MRVTLNAQLGLVEAFPLQGTYDGFTGENECGCANGEAAISAEEGELLETPQRPKAIY